MHAIELKVTFLTGKLYLQVRERESAQDSVKIMIKMILSISTPPISSAMSKVMWWVAAQNEKCRPLGRRTSQQIVFFLE